MRKILALILSLWTAPALAQGVPISLLPPASTPLAGTEVMAGVQNGSTVKIPANAVSPCQQFGTSAGTCAQGNAAVSSVTCFGTAITSTGTCTTTGQIPGTTTNDSASAGRIGEFVSSNVASGSAIGLSNNTPANVTSISLTAGDWDVWGYVGLTGNAATTVIYGTCSTSSTTATLDTGGGRETTQYYANVALFTALTGGVQFPCGFTRVSLSGTSTMYLVAQGGFGTNTMSAYGFIGARRAR